QQQQCRQGQQTHQRQRVCQARRPAIQRCCQQLRNIQVQCR
uniref:Chitin-binding protein 4 (Fragments) n=1 Tax=Moringa oleifera TaxID=3735 RepID=CBP4_MOROL|nr:RecName: Full=Chitin-binding protein 4; Short=Mo-CBP4; Contains: RecName: Full=Chitin-binding protein 4 chain A; Contains: RecName: Full=Chitin-binding protein 4 chain B [Moringa oleifera]